MKSQFFGKVFLLFILFSLFLWSANFTKLEASSLLLNPPFGNIEAGKDLVLDVVLKAKEEKIDGVDVVIRFDSKVLKVKEVKKGTFFPNFSKEVVDGSQLKMSALAPPEGLQAPEDTIVFTVVFEIYATGETSVDLSYDQGSTTDSNIILHETAKDTLTEVKNGRYLVTASPEKIEAARRAAAKPLNPLPFFILLLIVGGGAAWYILKKRKPKEDFFIPEPFPLDRPPKAE